MLKALARRGAPAGEVGRSVPARLSGGRARAAFLSLYAVAAVVTAVAVWLVVAAPVSGPIGPASQALSAVLWVNLLVILALAAVVGAQVLRLVRDRTTDAGARLRLRFVSLFAIAAVAPAVVVALFFGVLVTRGVDSWFNQRVRTAVENGAAIAKTYLDEQQTRVSDQVALAAGELGQIQPLFVDRIAFSRALEDLSRVLGYPAAIYVVDAQGRALARAEQPDAPPYLAPSPRLLASAVSEGKARATPGPDAIRAVYRLEGYGDAWLYIVRRLEPGLLARLQGSYTAITAYREAEASRARIQSAFVLSYFETALLVLVGAVWLGMRAATAIAGPVARLVQAADRVSGGDLDVRVETAQDAPEIAVLTRAFNRMTGDLQSQQEALRAAGAEAEARRRFIETVLSGVSAGVVGLDRQGRVSAANGQASALLGLRPDAIGGLLSEVAPDLAPVAALAVDGDAVEEDVDVAHRGETRRLRVRASRQADGGLVLTFDDITRLVAAQRNAAWRDVARRIAHEIKNPLTPIQLSAERLRRKYRSQIEGDLETFDRCTETIVRQVGDIGRMVDEFSAFARMPTPKFADEDATELLRQAVFAQRVANPDIDYELVEPLPEARFAVDSRMVGQALTNVLKNAAEAVAGRRATDPAAPGRIRARLFEAPGRVVFEVEDSGVGLPAKNRDRLTEPYVTTRDKGTGLGLAIVKRILEDHGGELALTDAEALDGARVTLSFPRTAAEAARESAGVNA